MDKAARKNDRSTQDIDVRIGLEVKELRISKGLSRSALAEKIGITHQQLHKYEAGINRLSVGRLIAIADVLDVPLEKMLKGGKNSEETAGYPRLVLEMMRDFQRIESAAQREAIRDLIHTLATQ